MRVGNTSAETWRARAEAKTAGQTYREYCAKRAAECDAMPGGPARRPGSYYADRFPLPVSRRLNDRKYIAETSHGDNVTWQSVAREKIRVPYVGNWQPLESMPRFSSPRDRAYYCDKWPEWARDVNPCDKESRSIQHTGWYTGAFADGETDTNSGTLRGYVIRMAGRNGKPVFCPGTTHSEWDGVTVYPLYTYDDSLECARAADEFARITAEYEREYRAEEDRKYQVEDKREEIRTIRADIRAIVRELKQARRQVSVAYPVLCKTLRGRIIQLRQESAEAYESLRRLEA